jgi:hypothetical protein
VAGRPPANQGKKISFFFFEKKIERKLKITIVFS